MRLLAKFSLIFVVVFGLGLAAAAYIFYGTLQRNAREQVLYNAQLMMDTALAMRQYTQTSVQPALREGSGTAEQQRSDAPRTTSDEVFRDLCAKHGLVGKQTFHPQEIPAFGAASLFAELRKNYPDYFYKEAAPNPTNPRNRALDWEEDVIKFFKNHPDSKKFDGERDTPLGRSLFIARPMRAPKACLQCHSTPAAAPPGMIKIYGTANGFGWNENDIIAAQIVSVPVALPLEMASQAFRHLLVSLVIVGLLTLAVVDLVLYATVIRPVSRFSARADEISKGQLDVPELPVRGHDEISVLAAAFNRLHRSVTAAMRMLEQEPEAARETQPPPEPEPDQG
jgi:protein-histidine pros-kinase